MTRLTETYRGFDIVATPAAARVLPKRATFPDTGGEAGLQKCREWVDTRLESTIAARRAPHIGSVEEYMAAFGNLYEHDRKMLSAHAAAPGHRLTATQLSKAAGWEGAGPANLHYGWRGRETARLLGLKIDDDEQAWTCALADYDGETGEWVMHPEAAEAVTMLNLR